MREHTGSHPIIVPKMGNMSGITMNVTWGELGTDKQLMIASKGGCMNIKERSEMCGIFASDIKKGTVFSGVIALRKCVCMKCSHNRVILLQDSGDWVAGDTWTTSPVIRDYKELNATLVIEDC